MIQWIYFSGIWSFDDNVEELYTFGAAQFGHINVAKWMFQENFSFAASFCSEAAKHGYVELVKWGIENAVATDINSVMFHATKSRNLELVKYLISKGVDVGNIIFKSEVESGSLDIVKYFVNDLKFNFEKSLLPIAADSRNLEMVKYFIEEHNLICKPDLVIFAIVSGSLEIVKYLCETHGCAISILALITAVKKCPLIFKWAVENGCNASLLTFHCLQMILKR